jgi:hypothetical protein
MLAARVVGVCPFELPDPELVAALCRSGAYGIVDVGWDAGAARRALASVAAEVRGRWGVLLHEGTTLLAADLPAGVTTVVLPAGVPIAPFRPRLVAVQVTSLE